MKNLVFILCFFCLSSLWSEARAAEKSTLHFRNDSRRYIAISWINPKTSATSLIKNNIEPDLHFTLNSFTTHRFEVRELPTGFSCGETGEGGEDDDDRSCKVGHFEVSESPEEGFVISKDFRVEKIKVKLLSETREKLIDKINLDAVRDPVDTLAECKARAYKKLEEIGSNGNDDDEDDIQDELRKCITVGLAPRMIASVEEVTFERKLREGASAIAENFTCVTEGLQSSPDVATEEWIGLDDVKRIKHVKLDRSASRIHVVEGFASPVECDAMEEEASKNLHVASTADGKGGTQVSAARKAMQAGIRPQFTDEGDPVDGNPIAVLSGRVYEYVNHVLDLNITHHGQEPLMSIQYFGRGRHDIEPDRYTPHCDGICTGEKHIYGSRMATMVIYCKIPEKGGFTNFQNANVHVKPKPGDAVFFSYFDPLTNVTDHGLTRHSGCPVYEGEKKIITQWVRFGVNKEVPHTAYNTLHILKSEALHGE